MLSGVEAGAILRAEVADRVEALDALGRRVGLATLLVGNDPASEVYVRIKHAKAIEAGIRPYDHRLPATAAQHEVEAFVDELNADPDVDAFLIQLPLPEHLDPAPVLERIHPRKDADGLHPHNLGRLVLGLPSPRPATPTGIIRLLDHHDIDTRGRRVVVVGRSALVGRPLSIMLSMRGRDATVTVAHTLSGDLAAITREADILVVAAGHPGLIGRAHVKPGAVVVDVGTTRIDSGLVGDVDFDAVRPFVRAITPVPGGVGPMTIAGLLWNTVLLAGG